MLMRLAYMTPMLLFLACASPEEQAREHAAAAVDSNDWWPIKFADQNKCAIQGFQEGTEAFAQCVSTTLARQRAPHRCTYCRSLD